MSQENVKYSVFRAVFRPFWLISDNLGTFVFWGSVFALVIMGLSLLFSAAFECSLTFKKNVPMCPDNMAPYLVYFIAKVWLIAVFIRLWVESMTARQKVLPLLKQALRGVLKTFLCFMIFIVLNLLPMLSGYILYFHAPNPNWMIELAVFSVIALGFLVPFVLIRFYSVLGGYLEDKPVHSLFSTWRQTSGLWVKLLFSTALIYVFILLSYLSAYSTARMLPFYAGAFVQNIILLLNVVLVVNFLLTQKYILWKEEKT